MKAFHIKVKIYASRIGNHFSLEVDRTIDVNNDTNLNEILDVPLGKLILGSAYKPKSDDRPTLDQLREMGVLQTEQWEVTPKEE